MSSFLPVARRAQRWRPRSAADRSRTGSPSPSRDAGGVARTSPATSAARRLRRLSRPGVARIAAATAATATLVGAATRPAGSATGTGAIALDVVACCCLLLIAVVVTSPVTRRRADTERAAADRDGEELRRALTVLHEVRASVAGLAGAADLMSGPVPVPAATAARLVAMGRAEVARMQYLLSDDDPGRPSNELGESLALVAESMRARGHRVDLRAEPARSATDVDEITTIVHILLDNAARHGSDPIELILENRVRHLVVSVTDAGPGVPEQLRPALFEWGVSGSGSSGIGLNDAHHRARAIGAQLRYVERPTPGTRFELIVPLPHRDEEVAP